MTQPIDLRVLANDELAITAAPGLGGRIVELTDLSNGREWLWRNHRVPFGPVASGLHMTMFGRVASRNCSQTMRQQLSTILHIPIMERCGRFPGRLCTPTITPSFWLSSARRQASVSVRDSRSKVRGLPFDTRWRIRAMPRCLTSSRWTPSSGICWMPSTNNPGRPASIYRWAATKPFATMSSFMCQTFPKGGAELLIPRPDRGYALIIQRMCFHTVGSS